MKNKKTYKIFAVILGLVLLSFPTEAAAHCDGLDGPVVAAARVALEEGTVEPTLKWVRPESETEIRVAFEQTLRVRAEGGEAAELADRWFFETLVRIHREGEGAPYTGLRPVGEEIPEGIAAADRALEGDEGHELAHNVGEHVGETVHALYNRVKLLEERSDESVEDGREYVEAYVEYIHFIETLHKILTHGNGH